MGKRIKNPEVKAEGQVLLDADSLLSALEKTGSS